MRVTGAASRAAAGIARVLATVLGVAIFIATISDVIARQFLGQSIYGSDEFARLAFLWLIWMGVSLAVRSDIVVRITTVADRGPWWWRSAVSGLAHGALAILLVYACVRSVQYATSPDALTWVTASLGWPFWIGVSSMAVGYVFITIHYADKALHGLAAARAAGADGVRVAVAGTVGGVMLAIVIWAVCFGLLAVGVAPLVPLAFVFVALTVAGMPIVFMLSFVGILGASDILGLHFFPFAAGDPLLPFRTTQEAMGLTGGGEFIVVLMFLLVAELLNRTGLSLHLIRFAASLVGHFRGGMAFVCQVTSALLSGVSGSAQADAAVLTPVLVPAMEKEGYERDVAAAVVAGASIKGPVGPISIMFIAYGFIVGGVGAASITTLLLSGVVMVTGLMLLQAAVIAVVVRRRGMQAPHPFPGWENVGRRALTGGPILLIPAIILGGIVSGFFTPTESASVAVAATIVLALIYRSLSVVVLLKAFLFAAIETGIVMLLIGDSAILAKLLAIDGFGQSLQGWITGVTASPALFLLIVIALVLLIGVFIEPLPALYILAPFLAPIAVGMYGIDPNQFALVMVLALVLGLIHPPVGLVLFLVASLAKVRVERLSVTILPWIGISLIGLLLVAYLPAESILWFAHLFGAT